MKLDNWSIVSTPFDQYQPPEAQPKFVQGTVSGHPIFPDGHDIVTAAIEKAIELEGRTRIFTWNGFMYELGTVNPDYEKMFPGAAMRVIKAWKRD